MKKIFAIPVTISLLFTLGACTSTTTSGVSSDSSSSISTEGELLIGTMRLENSDLAVTSDQAAALLPLWETLQSMTTSGTGAEAEVQALVDQIESTMTSAQIESITSMNLTSQDLQTTISEYKSNTTASTTSSSSATSAPQMPASAGMTAPAGNMGGGNPPADMGSPMNASGSTGSNDIAQAASTQSSGHQGNGTTSQIPASLIDGLVQLLQKKVG